MLSKIPLGYIKEEMCCQVFFGDLDSSAISAIWVRKKQVLLKTPASRLNEIFFLGFFVPQTKEPNLEK